MTETVTMPAKIDKSPETLRIDVDSQLGEFYRDVLIVAARSNGGTASGTAIAYLKQSLKANLPFIKERVQYLADRHGVTYDDMWNSLAAGRVTPIDLNAREDG